MDQQLDEILGRSIPNHPDRFTYSARNAWENDGEVMGVFWGGEMV